MAPSAHFDETPGRHTLPPRFQPLPRDRWQAAFDHSHSGAPSWIGSAFRVRCGMKDCPGDLGSVALFRVPDGGPQPNDWEYQVPRGFVSTGERMWAESKRASALRRRGLPPRGRSRRPHPRQFDWDMLEPLTPLKPFEMPNDIADLGEDGLPVFVECPICQRLMRFTAADAQAVLDERNGIG